MITSERLRQALNLDLENNRLFWLPKVDLGNHMAGKYAGTIDRKGYRRVQIDKRLYREHQLIWLWHKGALPVGQIDHIDGNKLNNSIANLREVSPSINNQNRRSASKRSKSGYLGVHWHKKNSVWVAKIGVGYEKKYLGCFESAEQAYQAYVAAKRELHLGNTL